jgi:acetyl-CoA C-acetyltransferase
MEIRREVLEEWTKISYERSRKAQSSKTFDWEIVDIIKDTRKGQVRFNKDEECQRYYPDSIPALMPIYSKNGALTAACSAKLNDGASAIVFMDEDYAKERGIKPLARVLGYEDSSVVPIDFTIANYKVTEDLLKKQGMN